MSTHFRGVMFAGINLFLRFHAFSLFLIIPLLLSGLGLFLLVFRFFFVDFVGLSHLNEMNEWAGGSFWGPAALWRHKMSAQTNRISVSYSWVFCCLPPPPSSPSPSPRFARVTDGSLFRKEGYFQGVRLPLVSPSDLHSGGTRHVLV